MGKIIIDIERCKGCNLCVDVCPKELLEISKESNRQGHHPARMVSSNECTGCCNCAIICPDVAIEVYSEVRIQNPDNRLN